MRIVSLVPSLTHLVVELGLRDQLVGCTAFCVEPPDLLRHIKSIGGTKDPDIDVIRALQPTHILVNHEENRAEDISACHGLPGVTVIATFPKRVSDIPGMMAEVGRALDAPQRAAVLVARFHEALSKLHRVKAAPASVLYLVWQSPFMAASSDTFISDLLVTAGFSNVVQARDLRYPSLTVSDIAYLRPDQIWLPSEPYPFRERDAKRLTEALGAFGVTPRYFKADGRLMSWHGPMTALALEHFTDWLSGDKSSQLLRELPKLT
jgi:ABC-type Fe3+-hydroxamate transport system substrate-binding protein